MTTNIDFTAPMDVIPAAEAITLPGLLKCRIERTPNLSAYQQYDREQNKWVTYSWQEIGRLVARWQQGLKDESLIPGDRVAILVANSIEWVCFEQAALARGLVVVPLYTWDSPGNIAYLLKDSGSRLLLAGTAEQWQKLALHAASFPELDKVVCLEEKPLAQPSEGKQISAASISSWLPADADHLTIQPDNPDSLATIVYTSGTTGPPKGVMLSHKNILWNAEAILKVIYVTPADVLLSFLPLSHTFERTTGYYVPMMAGASVAYTRSIEDLGEDMRTIRPTIIVSVPRIFEKIYAKVQNKLQKKGGLSLKLFQLAVAIGWAHFEADQGRGTVSPMQRLLQPLLQRIVGDKILDRMGGRIRIAVSGGAPLLETVSRFFLGLGLPLIQGYGLTESAPVVSANLLENNVPASVGPPLPDVQCKIGKDNELLVKSPGLMSGYWNLEDKSKDAFDDDGWLLTGDVVEIIDNNIHIRGRLKEIIVTSTGEKVPPADIEMTICADPLVDNIMIIGEGMPYIAALLALHRSQWEELARECGLEPNDEMSLQADAAKEAVINKLDHLLEAFPGNARIRTVGLLLDEWSIQNGLLTPTLKLKRQAVEDRYAAVIKGLYKGHEMPVRLQEV